MDTQTLAQALNLDQAKNGSIIAIIVCVALVLLVLKFVSSLMIRLAMSIVFAAFGVVVYSQRASLVDCAKKVSDQVSTREITGAAQADDVKVYVTCRFFGRDVSINLDK